MLWFARRVRTSTHPPSSEVNIRRNRPDRAELARNVTCGRSPDSRQEAERDRSSECLVAVLRLQLRVDVREVGLHRRAARRRARRRSRGSTDRRRAARARPARGRSARTRLRSRDRLLVVGEQLRVDRLLAGDDPLARERERVGPVPAGEEAVDGQRDERSHLLRAPPLPAARPAGVAARAARSRRASSTRGMSAGEPITTHVDVDRRASRPRGRTRCRRPSRGSPATTTRRSGTAPRRRRRGSGNSSTEESTQAHLPPTWIERG